MVNADSTGTQRSKRATQGLAKRLTAKHKGPFPLLKLPAVVRRRVFEILLTELTDEDGNAGVVQVKELPRGKFPAFWRQSFYIAPDMRVGQLDAHGNPIYAVGYYSEHGHSTQLFRACKQLYREAAPIFYSKNLFYFETARPLLLFLIDRRNISREYLAAISVPFPNGKSGNEVVKCELGCNVDWQGQPKFTHEFDVHDIWAFFARIFNDPGNNYPSLEVLDFRVPVVKYQRPHADLGKRWLWLPEHGYRVSEAVELAQLDMLRDLSIVTVSNHTVVKDVERRHGTFCVTANPRGIRKMAGDAGAGSDESDLPPAGDIAHVSDAELHAFKQNYAYVYALTPQQRGSIARLIPVLSEREYDRYASAVGRLTAGEVAMVASGVHRRERRGPNPNPDPAALPGLILRGMVSRSAREGPPNHTEAPFRHNDRLNPAVRAAIQRLQADVVHSSEFNRDERYDDETPPDVLRVPEKACFLVPLSEQNRATVRAAAAPAPAPEPPVAQTQAAALQSAVHAHLRRRANRASPNSAAPTSSSMT